MQSIADCLSNAIGDAGCVAGASSQTLVEFCQKHGVSYTREAFILFGKTRYRGGCPECDRELETKKHLPSASVVEALWDMSCVPAIYRDCRLSEFIAENQGQARVLRIVGRYIEKADDVFRHGVCLVFTGYPGTGKTYLACCIARAFVSMGRRVMYRTVLRAMSDIKEAYGYDSRTTESRAMKPLIDPDLLILDEVGNQHGTDYEKIKINQIISERRDSSKPTIMISNLDEKELGNYLDPRSRDRLVQNGGMIVPFTWGSHRRIKSVNIFEGL